MLDQEDETPAPVPVIAIDGHAGAGKSTVAEAIAHRLGFAHINTGSLYRALTWEVLQQGASPLDRQAVEQIASQTGILVELRPDGRTRVCVDGHDITNQLRTSQINQHVSPVSVYPGVREAVTRQLRQMVRATGIVMDGRDIGTVVFPNALLKIFLTASLDERAQRQHKEALERGQDISLLDLRASIERRDRIDSEREMAPLQLAEDAILLDTTDLSSEQVLERILTIWEAKQSFWGPQE